MKGLTLDSDEAAKPQAQNRPMSHEDMARMIAKNIAIATVFPDEDFFFFFFPFFEPLFEVCFDAGFAFLLRVSVVGVMIVAAGGFYMWGMNSYKDRFLGNTYINGIEVSGKTKAEAYKLVSEQAVIPKAITVTKKDGTTFSIKLSEIGYNDNTQNLIIIYSFYIYFTLLYNTITFFSRSISYNIKTIL